MEKVPHNLRDNPIYKDSVVVAEYTYRHVIAQLEKSGDEKWDAESRLRSSSTDLIFYVAQAIGSDLAEAAQYEWNNARKSLAALQSIYLFLGKRKLLEIDPDFVVKIDTLLDQYSQKIAESRATQEENVKKELEPWLEKYQLWHKMHSDDSE